VSVSEEDCCCEVLELEVLQSEVLVSVDEGCETVLVDPELIETPFS
jgi:hypothetical protein